MAYKIDLIQTSLPEKEAAIVFHPQSGTLLSSAPKDVSECTGNTTPTPPPDAEAVSSGKSAAVLTVVSVVLLVIASVAFVVGLKYRGNGKIFHQVSLISWTVIEVYSAFLLIDFELTNLLILFFQHRAEGPASFVSPKSVQTSV